MFGVSTFCLHQEPLTTALDTIGSVSDHIEIMDEGLHYLESAELLLSYPAKYSIHAPCRGTNIASLLEPIRKASIEVMTQCFAIATKVNAGVVVHPGYFAWAEERERAERQLAKSLSELSRLGEEYSVQVLYRKYGKLGIFSLKNTGRTSLAR